MNDTLLQFAGRLHPMVLHLPIGVLCVVTMMEIWGRLRGRTLERPTRLLLCWFLVVTTAFSIASGLLLAEEPGYVEDVIATHQWLGIATGVALLIAAVLVSLKLDRSYLATLLIATLLIVPTGHLGAGMTHGEGFLTAPFAKTDDVAPDNGASLATTASWYDTDIAPILTEYCAACHGATRRKGGLAMHTYEDLARGGASGSILAATDGHVSSLLHRLQLPLDHDDHMPPAGKPQPSPEQIDAIARWIETGATNIDASPTTPTPPAVVEADAADEPTIPDLPLEAIADLQTAHAHVEIIDPATNGLWVDCAGIAGLPQEELIALLTPVASLTAELSLEGVADAEAILIACAPWSQLRELDLSGTSIDAAALSAASEAGLLEELLLIGTSFTPDAAALLPTIDSLRTVHTWRADLPTEVVTSLAARETLTINDGSIAVPEPVEVEPTVVFGAEAAETVASLTPVNTACPVTGTPIDRRFTIVHDGQVVAFCCKNCPKTFWDDPSSFEVVATEPSD